MKANVNSIARTANTTDVPNIARYNVCHFRFIDGAFVEILGENSEGYRVQFIDQTTHEIVHEGIITNNQWIKTSRQYYTCWLINITRMQDEVTVISHTYSCSQQRVYVAIESASLGDTLAWLPAVAEFQKQHQCEMICSTFMNALFASEYPEITFIEPGFTVENLYAMYRIGWYYQEDGSINPHKNVRNFRERPLGETAYDVLGLPYVEQRPRLAYSVTEAPLAAKYVCIAVHATAQAKYWNNPKGWQSVVDYLRQRGYQVVLLSKEGFEYMGNRVPEGVQTIPEGPLNEIIRYLKHARLFIGIGSGLSWLAWAVHCRTCLISGFSYPYTEMQDCLRIFPESIVCSGCFNRHRLAADNWHWCPDHQHTPRMFECTKSITAEQVIAKIQNML